MRAACAALVLGFFAGGAAQADNVTAQTDLAIAGVPNGKATVFAAKTRTARVEVVPVMLLSMGGGSETSISVQDIVRNPRRYRSPLRLPSDADYLLVNGGFSAGPVDRPAGLLVARGKIVSIPNYLRAKAEPDSACPLLRKTRFRLSALLCVDKDGGLSVREFGGMDFGACSHAIQAGPMLVEAGSVAICKPKQRSDLSQRTALCLTRGTDDQRELKIVVTQTPVTLYELADWIHAPAGEGGLDCETAMNLSGDDSSGAALFRQRLKANAAAVIAGPGTYPQASFVTVTVR